MVRDCGLTARGAGSLLSAPRGSLESILGVCIHTYAPRPQLPRSPERRESHARDAALGVGRVRRVCRSLVELCREDFCVWGEGLLQACSARFICLEYWGV